MYLPPVCCSFFLSGSEAQTQRNRVRTRQADNQAEVAKPKNRLRGQQQKLGQDVGNIQEIIGGETTHIGGKLVKKMEITPGFKIKQEVKRTRTETDT